MTVKKIATIVVAALLIVCCLTGIACNKVEGDYKFSKMIVKEKGAASVQVNVGDQYGGNEFDADSVTMKVSADNTFTFSAPNILDDDCGGTWEKITVSDKEQVVLNFNANGYEIITGSIVDGKAEILIYVNGVDYKINLV